METLTHILHTYAHSQHDLIKPKTKHNIPEEVLNNSTELLLELCSSPRGIITTVKHHNILGGNHHSEGIYLSFQDNLHVLAP